MNTKRLPVTRRLLQKMGDDATERLVSDTSGGAAGRVRRNQSTGALDKKQRAR